MPISSYLIHPINNSKIELIRRLSNHPNWEVTPSTNKNLLILVTDTKSLEDEENLQNELNSLKSLGHFSLVFAHD